MSAPDPVVTQGLLYIIGAVAVFVGGSTITVTSFILNGFTKTRNTLFAETGKLRTYFERVISTHNKEDDDRFEKLNTEVWRLHLRNARKDGTTSPDFEPLPRRRYVHDSDESDGSDAVEMGS